MRSLIMRGCILPEYTRSDSIMARRAIQLLRVGDRQAELRCQGHSDQRSGMQASDGNPLSYVLRAFLHKAHALHNVAEQGEISMDGWEVVCTTGPRGVGHPPWFRVQGAAPQPNAHRTVCKSGPAG